MQAGTKQVKVVNIATVSVPGDLHTNLTGAYFIDGIGASATSSNYRSGALMASYDGTNIGMVAYNKTSAQYEINEAPQSITPFTAVCGISDGRLAVAKVDENIPFIALHGTPITGDSGWQNTGSITIDGISGPIQNMIERNGTIYGFIKGGTQNAFFSVAAQDSATAQLTPYTGTAADAYFPVPSQYDGKQNITMARRIAYYQGRIYAIDESHANALYVPLSSLNVGSVPLAKSDTWGLIIDESRSMAFGTYQVDKEYIMPYAIQGDGTLNRSGYDTVKPGAADSPSLDTQLGLLYTCSFSDGLQVFDSATCQVVPFAADSPNPVPAFAGGIGGTWADSANGILYLGAATSDPSKLLAYQVTLSN
ncbi:hypothetical protein BOSP111201_19455 [Bordetella sputigena]